MKVKLPTQARGDLEDPVTGVLIQMKTFPGMDHTRNGAKSHGGEV